jgi:hypothetical protein
MKSALGHATVSFGIDCGSSNLYDGFKICAVQLADSTQKEGYDEHIGQLSANVYQC